MAENKAYISQITLPTGNTYYIKDAEAREEIAQLTENLTGALLFVGVTSTEISNGSTVSQIFINETLHVAQTGDVVIFGTKEFVYSSTGSWIELGDFSDLEAQLGEFAYLNLNEVQCTPVGGVNIHTDTDLTTVTCSGTFDAPSITSTPSYTSNETTFEGIYTPQGEIKNTEIEIQPDIRNATAWNGTVNNENLTFSLVELSYLGDATGAAFKTAPVFSGYESGISTTGEYQVVESIATVIDTPKIEITTSGQIRQISNIEATFSGEPCSIQQKTN